MHMTQFSSSLPAAEDNFSYLSDEPLNIVGLLSRSHHPNCGAVVLFSGEVRDSSSEKEVTHLEYEAQPTLAAKMMQEIIADARKRWPLHIAVAQHRTGKVSTGESAVVVITATPHRKEAYEANRYIIDRIKHEVPIWKCEYFADGSHEWGGNCNCQKITGDPSKHVYEF